jgi:multiple sugar transport system substrate-binding protein
MARTLTGIIWDHSRALPPLVATAQRYEELHPGVRIQWQKRTLHEFGHMPIDVLAERFDLVVIDHPWAGYAFDRQLVHDLKPLLAPEQFTDLKNNSVGPSFDSYLYRDQLLAIPIDAATPAPSYRPDLLAKAGVALPKTFSDLIALARKKLAVMPGFPADLYLNFLMLCHALGGKCFTDRERMVDRATGHAALELLRQLAEPMPREIFEWNPIRVAEQMSRTDHFAYCCFAYSYNNYARPGFAEKLVRYANLVTLDDGRPLRSIIGGTGIAISTRCREMELALDYSLFTGSAGIQRGIYTHAGGQPSRTEAWDDDAANALTSNFFRDKRRTQDESLVRPRYHGYVPVQEEGGVPLIRHLRDGESAERVLDAIDAAYRKSLPPGDTVPLL